MQYGVSPIPVRQSSELWWHIVTKLLNIGLASYMAMFTFFAILRTFSEPWNPTAVVITVVVVVWLAGAVGLFFKSRLAWWASVIGIGTMLVMSLVPIYKAMLLILVTRGRADKIDVLVTLIAGLVGTVICLPILIGLLGLRRTLVPVTNTANWAAAIWSGRH
jgi:hypothetical protein